MSNLNEVVRNLARIGVSGDDAIELRRIAMTLHRWSELECNGEVERDEETGKTYYAREGRRSKQPCADREYGAKRRLAAIMHRHPLLTAYIQGDPRGAPLYVIERERIGGRDIDSCYSSIGIAVYK